MAAAEPGAALAPDRVDFINKHNAGGIFFRLFKQIADTGSPYADEHLNEIRTGDGKERNACFTCYRTGQQSFTGARRAHKQNAFGDARTQLVILPRVFQELHDFAQFFFFFILAGHICKCSPSFFIGHLLKFRFSEIHLLASITHGRVQPLHGKPPECKQNNKNNNRRQKAGKNRRIGRTFQFNRHSCIRMGFIIFFHIWLNGLLHQLPIRCDIRDLSTVFQKDIHFPIAEVHCIL